MYACTYFNVTSLLTYIFVYLLYVIKCIILYLLSVCLMGKLPYIPCSYNGVMYYFTLINLRILHSAFYNCLISINVLRMCVAHTLIFRRYRYHSWGVYWSGGSIWRDCYWYCYHHHQEERKEEAERWDATNQPMSGMYECSH